MFPSPDDQLLRYVRKLEARVNQLFELLRGLRSERRARVLPKRTRWKGVVTESGGIAYGASGQVRIYENGIATSWYVTAYNDWIDGGTLALNTKVVVEFWQDENKFGVQDAECP